MWYKDTVMFLFCEVEEEGGLAALLLQFACSSSAREPEIRVSRSQPRNEVNRAAPRSEYDRILINV